MPDTVLITGATGFAGSFLVELYLDAGWTVHGTYRDPIGEWSPMPEALQLHHVDLLDPERTRRLVHQVRPDVIQHLAAQSSVAASWDDPAGTILGNVSAQLNLLEAASTEASDASIVVVGSCDEYGDVPPEDNPVVEEQELRPTTPYGLSKVGQDLMGYQYATSKGMQVVRVRPFLQLGPRRTDRFVAGSFARQVAEIASGMREPVIEVGNIDLSRDFTDVRDVARAYQVAAESGTPGRVYNIASGTGRSLREMLGVMMSAAGVQAEIRQEDALQRSGEPDVLIGDATRFTDATGWTPRISFEQSVADTLAYWQDQIERREGIMQ